MLLYKKTGKLRKNLLSKTNLPTTKALLNSEWKKSGKTWNVFIKDYEAHHIIPKNLLEKSKGLQFYYNNGGTYRFNSIENGIMLKKVSKGGYHAKHPNYTRFVLSEVEKINKSINSTKLSIPAKNSLFEKKLIKLKNNIKSQLIKDCINNNKKVNAIF